jgi:hypothetical protein
MRKLKNEARYIIHCMATECRNVIEYRYYFERTSFP